MNPPVSDIPVSLTSGPATPNFQRPRRKVLFILGTLWGENGITSHLLTLSKGLQSQGWDAAIASGLASMDEDSIQEARRAVERFAHESVQHFEVFFPALKPSVQGLKELSHSVFALDEILSRWKPDVIHLHSLSVAPIVRLAAARHRIPIVSTSHLEPEGHRSPSSIKAIANYLLNGLWGDRLIAISREIQVFFQDNLKVPPQNVKLLYHGIDDAHFRPPSPEERNQARSQFNLKPDDRVICLVGRLGPVKGHDILIQALSILKQQNFPVIALFAGKGYGDEVSRVIQQAEEHDVLDQIQCLGMVDSRPVLWASEIITLPSRREGFPLVILEGMLCGLIPIRTPAAGATDQIQDGRTGWIVPFDDPALLAQRIRQTFEDEALKLELSTQALLFAQEHFTIDRMIHQTTNLYGEVLMKNKVKK